MSKVGFVGLGIMGRPMAQHLRAGGHEIYVHDHKPAPSTLIAQGAVKPVVHQTFALAEARRAHELVDSAQHIGKVILVTAALA